MKILVVDPGANTSTLDVAIGLRYGLKHHGIDVVPYRLDQRIEFSRKWLHIMWRQKKKDDPTLQKPGPQDVMYHAGVGAMEMALRHQVDAVLVVSAMLLHPDVVVMMKRAGLRVVVLFTESPYDEEQELRIAKLVDGCWTTERTSVPTFRVVNPRVGYLPHAWHPDRHFVSDNYVLDTPSHDVVFVGSGFPERVAWFNSIDWTGIDLGLYGTWKGLGLNKQVAACVRGAQITNEQTSALYRRAKIGLNLYRSSVHAESLSPRAYELAACGTFHLSTDRKEVHEVFGDLVPTFTTPAEGDRLIRQWLADPLGREQVALLLPACVAESSWVHRAPAVIGDLQHIASRAA
jgi:hypothetical protein